MLRVELFLEQGLLLLGYIDAMAMAVISCTLEAIACKLSFKTEEVLMTRIIVIDCMCFIDSMRKDLKFLLFKAVTVHKFTN